MCPVQRERQSSSTVPWKALQAPRIIQLLVCLVCAILILPAPITATCPGGHAIVHNYTQASCRSPSHQLRVWLRMYSKICARLRCCGAACVLWASAIPTYRVCFACHGTMAAVAKSTTCTTDCNSSMASCHGSRAVPTSDRVFMRKWAWHVHRLCTSVRVHDAVQ